MGADCFTGSPESPGSLPVAALIGRGLGAGGRVLRTRPGAGKASPPPHPPTGAQSDHGRQRTPLPAPSPVPSLALLVLTRPLLTRPLVFMKFFSAVSLHLICPSVRGFRWG